MNLLDSASNSLSWAAAVMAWSTAVAHPSVADADVGGATPAASRPRPLAAECGGANPDSAADAAAVTAGCPDTPPAAPTRARAQGPR